MIKENLYCVPYEKRVLRSSKGISYHCERDEDSKKKNVSTSPKQNPKPKDLKQPKPVISPSKMEICNVCGKGFKDTRAMKIHKTKQKHHQEKQESIKKKSPEPPVKQNKKRNRSYSMSPNEKRAIKALIKEAA